MEGEIIDSGRDKYRSAGGDTHDPDIFHDLDRGSARGGGSAQGGSRADGSGLSQAVGASTHVSINSRASYRVPSVIGGRTVTPTGNYFDNANWHSRQDITGRKVVCPKGKRGAQGSRNYDWHHSAATAAIPELFGAAKHFCTKISDGELYYKYKDIQSEYMGNLDKLKLFGKRMEAFDMFDLFIVPLWIDPNTISVLDRWGGRKVNWINITKHWSQVLLEHVCAWQRNTFDWCSDDNDLTSME